MSATTHTPEPWRAELTDDPEDGSDAYSVDCDEHSIALMDAPGGLELNEANARRIAACVNACKGLSTELLECQTIDAAAKTIVDQRDELAEALREMGDWLAYGLDKPNGARPTAADLQRAQEVAAKGAAALAKVFA